MKFNATKKEHKLISTIANRAVAIADKFGLPSDRMDIMMDLEAVHSNGNPLKFDELLAADDTELSHDVFGIRRHIDRETGELKDCFLPRFSV